MRSIRSHLSSFSRGAGRVVAPLGASQPLVEPLEGRLMLTSVTFPDFSTVTGLQLNGSTVGNVSNGIDPQPVLRLTPAAANTVGSAFSKTTIRASTFSTFFEFRITDSGGVVVDGNKTSGADGIAFVVQAVANNVGAKGGGIGYRGITHSIGVTWDDWHNTKYNDPSTNYVGIDVNGNVVHTIPATNTQNIAEPFKDGKVWYCWVDYNGTTLEVRTNQSGVRPATPNVSEKLDLVSILGQSTAYVGFTSGTGDAWENHDVLNWQYRDNYRPVTSAISGTVINDTNANGKQDAGEKSLAAVKVYIDANNNGKLDAGEITVTTDANGNYSFPNLSAGTYRVREVVPANFVVTVPTVGFIDVPVSVGQNVAGKLFFDAPATASISGKVFDDVNSNGVRDGEAGLGLFKLFIDSNNDGVLQSTEKSVVSDIFGNWSFTGLTAGSYTVRVVQVTGLVATKPVGGVMSIKLTAGQSLAGLMFGEKAIA